MAEALDGIPERLGRLMENVAVFVEEDAARQPARALPGRAADEPQPRLRLLVGHVPDARPDHDLPRADLSHRRTEAEVVDQVRVTVIHEVAHHFGIDDARLHELGWA